MPDYPVYRVYRLAVTTLTPLHIGSGVTLLNEYDYAVRDHRTWRIDETAFLNAQEIVTAADVTELVNTPPARLLSAADFDPQNPNFRYVIQGAPRPVAEGALVTSPGTVREQLKDSFDRPYLPGSSLKGALRTALAWYGWGELKLRPRMNDLAERERWAAQNYERMIFVNREDRRGKEPNHDLLRALQVADSRPLSPERLMLLNAAVLNGDGALVSPVELEAIRAETTFELTAKLDLALFSNWAKSNGMDLPGEKGLRGLPGLVNRRAFERAREEAAWYARIPAAARLSAFYKQLLEVQPQENQFLLQLGWGTGWEDKTLGSRLQSDPDFMQDLIRAFHLSRGRRKLDSSFPASRRVTVSGDIPVTPLGWLLVTFEPVPGVPDAPGGWEKAVAGRPRPVVPAALPPRREPASAASRTPPQPERSRQARTPAPKPAEPRRSEPRRSAEPQRAETRTQKPTQSPAPVLVERFAARPRPGQRFTGLVLDVTAKQVFIELPGLSADDWMGIANLPERKPREGETVLCEVVTARADPQAAGAWLVECRIL